MKVLHPEYIKKHYNSIRGKQNNLKIRKYLSRDFINADIRSPINTFEKTSNIGKMQSGSTRRSTTHPLEWLRYKTTNNTKCWPGCGTLVHTRMMGRNGKWYKSILHFFLKS